MVKEYGLKPWEIGKLTPEQYRMLLDALPSLAYRDNLQMAEFMATVLNIMGGKPDPTDKDTKLVPPERMYTSEDTIVWFAKEPKVSKWTPAAARVALDHRDRLPTWARDAMPWALLEALGPAERATD